ncbi:MAG: co-chaperone GroES [Candidatus Saccharibacteria bacterium]|nr:co-chaperone GroES [Candidatus Saccharibacteria bacterium]
MSNVPLKPLADRVVAIREEATNTTNSGLYLPVDKKEKSQIARVVAVGDDVKEIKDDDRIIVREYSTSDIKVDGTEYIIVKEEDVLAIVK